MYHHKSVLSNYQFIIAENIKEAKEALCALLKDKGNLSKIDNVKDSQKYTATYIDNNGNAQSSYYSALELQNGQLYIGLSDEHWLYEEDIKAEHILDLITIIEEGHGKHTNKKLDLTKPNISRQFFRKEPNGSWTQSDGIWEDMAQPKSWDFIEQLLPDYDQDEDVTLSNDLSCVIEKEDSWDMVKFVGYHPEYKGYTIEQLVEELEEVNARLYQEAEDYLQKAIEVCEILVREFPVTIVSAKPKRYCNIMLQPVNEYYQSPNYPNGYGFLAEEFQNVESRIIDGKFQVRNPNKINLEEQWYNANPIDFE